MTDAPLLTALLGNSQRLDGGAMFGNAPKALWTRWAQPDDANRIPLACRALLIEEAAGRKILLETGIGTFLPPKMRSRFGVVEDEHVLLASLASHGLSHADIDVVVLSHLHFDHAGGLLTPWHADREPELLFPKARFVVGERAWARGLAPHFRDRASFIPALAPLLLASGRLEIVSGAVSQVLGTGYRFHVSDGHTPGLVCTEIATALGPVVFAADLIPGTPWVHLPITMGYDRFPEQLIDEKRRLLEDLEQREGWLFYTHDPSVALSRVERDDRGRFGATSPVEAPVRWGAIG